MGCFQLVDADRVGSVRLTESLNEPVEVSVVVCDLSKFADCFLSPRRLRETLTLLGCSHTHAQHHDAPVGAFVDLGGHETWLLEDYLPDSVGDPSNQLVLPRWVDRPGIDQDWGFHCTIHSFQGESDEASGSRGAKATGCSKICAPSSGCCLTSATSPAHRLGNIGDTILERFRGPLTRTNDCGYGALGGDGSSAPQPAKMACASPSPRIHGRELLGLRPQGRDHLPRTLALAS